MAEYRKWLFRRDTAANWTSADPTLMSGEMGFETDTNKIKIGNGTTAWTALDYVEAVVTDIDAYLENPPTEDEAHKTVTSEWAFDHNARDATSAVQGHATAAQITKLDGIEAGADVTDATNVDAAGAVMEADYNANTILAATSDDTPAALTVGEQTVVGRITGGNIAALSVSEIQTLVLSASLPENVAIILDPALSADGKYSGMVEAGTAGATLAFGEVVYQAVADDRWELAQADAEATTKPRLGICVLAAAGDGEATNILLIGKIRADAVFPAFTKYAPVFLSPTTAGDLTNTAPSTAGQFIRCVGQAITATELWFNPDNMWWENV